MSSYQQFVKKEMAELKGSGVPPRQRMAEVARRWRAQKGRATAMAPKRSPKKPRRRIAAMAGAGSGGRAAMSGGGMAALGPATQDLEGAGFLESIGSIAETALKVAPLAMMVL